MAPREVDERLSAVQTQLLQRVAARLVRAAAAAEQVARVEAEAALDRAEDLMRLQAAALADALMEREREARVARGQPARPRGLALVHEALQEMGRFRVLQQQVAGELLERRQSELLQLYVLPQLLRLINGREAARGMDAELQYYVARHHFAAVLDALHWQVGKAQAAQAARAEQDEQVRCGFTLAAGVEHAHVRCMQRIDRLGRVRAAIAAADQEQAERITRDRQHAVCEEVRRTVARRGAAAAADLERSQRMSVDRMQDALEDIVRLGNRRAVAALVAAQPPREYVPGRRLTPLTQKLIIEKALVRVHARQCAERRTELVQRHLMWAVVEELGRLFGGRLADALEADARAERRHQDLYAPVMAALLSRAARQQARAAAFVEQRRQLLLPREFSHARQFARVLAAVHSHHYQLSARAQTAELAAQARAQHLMRESVLPGLVSMLARREAALLAAEAQGQWIAQDRMQRLVLPELERVFARREVHRLVQEAMLAAPPSPLPQVRLHKARVNASVRRRAHARDEEEERQTAESQRRYLGVMEQLERRANARLADDASALERDEV